MISNFKRIDDMVLDHKDIHEILTQLLPAQNDFHKSDYFEELGELIDFKIYTKALLFDLVSKHREKLLEIDAEELDDFHVKYYSHLYGEDYVKNRIENKFWFSYPALLRIALELEFGEKYSEYANQKEKT